MSITSIIYLAIAINFFSFATVADEFDDPPHFTTSMPKPPADYYSLPDSSAENKIDSDTQISEQTEEDRLISNEVAPETLEIVDDIENSKQKNPDSEEPVVEKVTWTINEYMPGCDHDVRDCVDAAKQLKTAEGTDQDELLFDCIEAHECTPLQRWSCDHNLNFMNRHEALTHRCLKWGLYQYQEQEEETENPIDPEVDREL